MAENPYNPYPPNPNARRSFHGSGMYTTPDALPPAPPPAPPPPRGDGGGSDGRGGDVGRQVAELEALIEDMARAQAQEAVEAQYAAMSQEGLAAAARRSPFSGEHGKDLTNDSKLADIQGAAAKNAAENIIRAPMSKRPAMTDDGRIDLTKLPNQGQVAQDLEDAYQDAYMELTGAYMVRGDGGAQ